MFDGDGVARVVAREAGVLSGVAALEETARQVDPALAVEVLVHDGERFAAGDDASPSCAARWRRSSPPSAPRSTSSAG